MDAFLYINTPQIVDASSSGGAFHKIVTQIFSEYKDVKVYGATWTSKFEIMHTCVTKIDELNKLSGSKYSRSKMGDTFSQVATSLSNGEYVIFSGTPCQVAGLKQFLKIKRIDTKQLLLIDIICHGTPSPKMLQEWKNWIENKYKDEIIDINFRDKKVGWRGYPTTIKLKKKILQHTFDSQQFIRLFFSHLILGDSCYECVFAKKDRCSDITIGDFWGANEIFEDLSGNNGISLVLANTKKGKNLVLSISNNLEKGEVIRKCHTERFLDYQQNLNSPTERPYNTASFWQDYKTKGYKFVLKKYKISTNKLKLKFYIKKFLSKLCIYNKPY